jgi:hypothetical protein
MSNTGAKADLLRDIEAFTCGEEPSPLLMLGCPIIDEWSTSIMLAGKEYVLRVRGVARRHPDYEDGALISTSAVLWFDRHARWVRTTRGVYKLAEPAGEEVPIEGIMTE